MRISLHGSYFGNNYGDILLMKLFTQWIREYNPSIMINYPMLKDGKILDPPQNTTCGLWNLLRSDALVFFGGGYFGEKPTKKQRWSVRNFYRHAIVAILAIVFRIPYAIIGVEFGPISVSWFKRCVIFIAKHAKCLVVRNEESLIFLNENGVRNVQLSFDAVLSLSDYVNPIIDTTSKNKILLHITKQSAKVIDLVKSIILALKNNNINNVGFIEDEPGQYKRFYNDTISRLFDDANIEVEKYIYEGTDKVISVINDSEMIITTKLHVGIAGIALNKKVFSVYYHPKTLRLHKQVNNEDNCMALNDVDETVSAKISEFIKKDQYLMPKKVLDAARENRRVLYSFLDNELANGKKR